MSISPDTQKHMESVTETTLETFETISAVARTRLSELHVCCRYHAVKHLCVCGCGAEINTPLHPTGWTLTCDGVSVSLSPSIGNWSEKCQSHYWVINNQIQWVPKYPRRKFLN